MTLLVYGPGGEILPPGRRTIAVLRAVIGDPASVTSSGLVVAGEGNTAIRSGVSFGEGEDGGLPTAIELGQNYPNPFNPSTEIRFAIPQASEVRITIYNTLGQEVRTLFAGLAGQGTHAVRWDGRDNGGNPMSSGIYLYRMNAGTIVMNKKMMLLK
jgi:hypothetical protein